MSETMTFPRTRQGLRNLDEVPGDILPISGGPAPERVNVSRNERWLSAGLGAALALIGLSRAPLPGLGVAAAGGALMYRGLTGYCPLYQLRRINTAGRTTHQEIVYRRR